MHYWRTSNITKQTIVNRLPQFSHIMQNLGNLPGRYLHTPKRLQKLPYLHYWNTTNRLQMSNHAHKSHPHTLLAYNHIPKHHTRISSESLPAHTAASLDKQVIRYLHLYLRKLYHLVTPFDMTGVKLPTALRTILHHVVH